MSTSLVAHLSRSGDVHIVDSDAIPHADDLHPIMGIAVAVMNAGYTGLAIDELELSNGRIAHALDVNLATPEGRLLQELSHQVVSGREVPNIRTVLAGLQRDYKASGNSGSAA